jgi:hypothetical protein
MTDGETHFDPRAYMKARRPYLFSDSGEKEAAPVTKDQFEYHLETLTNRQEETPFERFGRDLIKKEICPNLMPHTGPTGGGDGKTDSETYQVSEEIAALWWVGDPKRSSNERLAFCFSAKKDWKPKFKKDVESAVSTGREFTVIYFMTNQYVPSRERAELQDEYSKAHKRDIRILDRTWILESVFDHRHWDVVTKHFDIGKTVVQGDGPQDAQRKLDLEALEKKLADAQLQGIEFAEDCLDAALLARTMDLPTYQVYGMFERAERAAEKLGSSVQQFRVVYKRAWTGYFWFNDFSELSRLYEKAEELILTNDSAFLLEDLGNLCQIGLTVTRDPSSAGQRKLWLERAERLNEALRKLTVSAPGTVNSLWAQTQLYMSELTLSEDKDVSITKFSEQVQKLLPEVSRHADYPVQVLHKLADEFGEYIVDNEAFDALFEALILVEETRTSEASRGRSRLTRGAQFLQHGKWYQAIDQLAKAQALLAKEEHHDSYVCAIFLTGLAYQDAGLLWAARANMAVAISISMQNKLKFGHLVPSRVVRMLQELASVELALGRIVCALQVLEMSLMISSQMQLTDSFMQTYQFIDFVMARLIIETPLKTLNQLSKMPDVLASYLGLSSSMLLFCLGYEKEAVEAIGVEDFGSIATGIVKETNENLDQDFLPQWYVSDVHVLRSKILGCTVELTTKELPGILIGESLLAFIEDFLATAVMLKRCMATVPKVCVRVDSKPDTGFTVQQEENEAGEITVVISYSFDDIRKFANPPTYSKRLFEAVIPITTQMGLTLDEQSLVALFEEHEVMTRSQFGASSFTSILKLFGETPRYFPHHWTDNIGGNVRIYDMKRTETWQRSTSVSQRRQLETQSASNSEKITDIETLQHTELSVQSPINLPLWKKARWDGTAFGTIDGDWSRVEFWLTFKDIDAGRKIFKGWRNQVGAIDAEEWLGISIITGIDKEHPTWYKVVISINEDYIEKLGRSKGLMLLSPTELTMTPQNTANLDRFLNAFKHSGWYDLGPAKGIPGVGLDTQNDLLIRKKSLEVIPAWQIPASSMLCISLRGIENPVIPPDVSEPPIKGALEKYKSLSQEPVLGQK